MPLLWVDLGSAAGSVVIGVIVFIGIVVGGLGVSRAQKAGWRTGAGDVLAIAILAGSLTAAGFVVAHAVNALDASNEPSTTVPNAKTFVSVHGSTESSTPETVSSVSSGATESTSGGKTTGSSSASTATQVTGGAETIGPTGDAAGLVRLLMVFVLGFALIGILLLYRHVPPLSAPPDQRLSAELGREKAGLAAARAAAAKTCAEKFRSGLGGSQTPSALRGHAEDAHRAAVAAETLAIETTAVATLLGRDAAKAHARDAVRFAGDAATTANVLCAMTLRAPVPSTPEFRGTAEMVIAQADAARVAATQAKAKLED